MSEMSKAAQNLIYFSRFVVNEQVFFKSKFTYALVNLKPIVPGHVLVVPLRVVERFKDLTEEESIDYVTTLQRVHKFIEYIYKADSMNIAIQDGPEAGQSVPHLHTHLIPRHKVNNFGDRVYDYLNSKEFDLDDNFRDFYIRKQIVRDVDDFAVKPDSERYERSKKQMQDEAIWLAKELEKYESEK